MGFRTLEISRPSELHVSKGQLLVTQEDGEVSIPLEDLITIVCVGSNIRLSTMGMSQISEAGITLMAIDEKYKPVSMVTPVVSNARQALIMRRQVHMDIGKSQRLWVEIIRKKIENQSRALSILGLAGAEKVMNYIDKVDVETVDHCEAAAAKEYFTHFHPGLNRRNDDPINSQLNYGYAVLRNAIIRSLILAGFQPAFGLHHESQLNAFNLADDIIEPWRPMIDLIAHSNVSQTVMLNRKQRKELAMVLHHACSIDDTEMSVISGIDCMINSIKKCVMSEDNDCSILLPTILPIKEISLITE